MCGYACIGCGACGKHKSKLFDLPPICCSCGVEMERGTVVCPSCGFDNTPGKALKIKSVGPAKAHAAP